MDPELSARGTDQRVLQALLEAGRLTRAEVASVAEISKPTASQSIRRLSELGLVTEGARQSGGRGRAGTYCQPVENLALAIAAKAGPGEVVLQVVDAALGGPNRPDDTAQSDLASGVVTELRRPIGLTATVAEVGAVLAELIVAAESAVGQQLANRVISIASPVDVRTGQVVRLASAPFLLDEGGLTEVTGGHGLVDNDVVWAATAELAIRAQPSFLYLYLGEGMGAAIIDDGRVVHGRRGLSGEVAYLLTTGPDGRSMPLIEVLERLGLTVPGTSALAVDQVRAVLQDGGPDADVLYTALADAVISAVTLLDPGMIVLGGPWGADEAVAERLSRVLADRGPYPLPVETPLVAGDAALIGVRAAALDRARANLLEAVR